MSLGEETRKSLRKIVPQARDILTEDLSQVLEARFGVRRDGTFEPPGSLPSLTEARERETREVLETVLPPPGGAKGERSAFGERFDVVLRSLAFTHLNRLVAFKLMEHPSRKLIKETVGRGAGSRGFLLWAPRDAAAGPLLEQGRDGDAYRLFLLAQCALLDREIGVLFDPDDLASRVFPSHQALLRVIDLVNHDSLAAVWEDEEALGWVYQFYTPKELRDTARKQSSVPRNPYEMAFLNQFYTPDYVVRFLVDNTLGRLWLEMRGGHSVLRERCTLLAVAPSDALTPRPKKDPREIRLLDPAGGSGHFLLYAFTVFRWIYEEAWEDADLHPALARDYGDRERFAAAVPALILEHNLHGIDIDRRAVQIASLALYLKAKSAAPDTTIERVNFVWAGPMPGDRQHFEEFKTRTLAVERGVLARILDRIWDELDLAGEVGSVLKLGERVSGAIAEERKAWQQQQRDPGYQAALFAEAATPRQQHLDFSDVGDEAFWRHAEGELERLLGAYAAGAEGAERAKRRLFARNSVEGLHFVEVMRKRFDVVLMNPPFGAMTPKAKPYVERHYPRTKNDIYAVFVERFLGRLTDHGYLGAITSRTGFFLSSFQKWREEVLLKESSPVIVADLGHGVMDDAMVEAAAYVLAAPAGRRAAP
jgi:hypothetical protein